MLMRGAAGRAVVAAALAALLAGGVAAYALLSRTDGNNSATDGGASSGLVAMQTATPAPEASPSPEPTPTPPPPSPTPSPTPAARNVNGLMIVDEVWVGRIADPQGLRIRSAPRVEPGNVVGSLAAGTEVTVEGRVLNGQEAEPGKGTIWLIVGPSQYIYAAPGYVERVR